jgi:la-related protein 1
MSTFSYAQAAKGASGTPTPSKTPSEPEKIDSKPEEQPTETTTETVPAPTESEAPQTSEKVAVEETKDDDFTTVTNKHAAKKAVTSRTSSPSVRTTSKSRKSKEDDSSNTPNGTAEATSEKQASTEGKTDAVAEKSHEKSEESTKDAAPPKELKAAPLPSINIWQQRREAQDAKVKTAPKSVATGKATKGASDETQQDSKASKKKGAESAPEGTKDRKKTEGGKGRDAGKISTYRLRHYQPRKLDPLSFEKGHDDAVL